jgi:septum formation protein
MTFNLVLASASPRRQQLIGFLGVPYTIRAADLDETPRVGEAAAPYVGRLAIEKALAVANPGEIVLAADTTVALNGEIFGKPTDVPDAVNMLTRICGTTHQVHTGMALVDGNTGTVLHSVIDTTQVHMRAADLELIKWYVNTGEPMDKAGSYALQGIGCILVDRVEGNAQTVIGLNMTTVHDWLRPLFSPNLG